ncbi:bifunctional phosphopantothenoylcysteine decarboxylase/phosphopantothenate--cysteine ligase CoaBC [Halomonas shantousis]
MPQLAGTRVLLGVSAGIAAYKSAHLARLLKKAGAEVHVVMTEGAQAFITPLTFQALTGEAVRTSLLDPEAEAGMGHIELAKWADLVLIAPATADLMVRLAHGHADDLLTTLCLATEAQCLMAPAMNQAMWRHPATQRNAQRLREDGWQLLGPAGGEQACGDVGPGRMQEPEEILDALQALGAMSASGSLAQGVRVTLTAGPTREAIDPVRYLTNHSSGKMGYALASAFARQGARVRLISGPVTLPTPADVERIDVVSTQDMLEAASQAVPDTDIFIGCAAVADYRAEQISEHKLKKTADDDTLSLRLVKNPDIIAELASRPDRPFMVGFAAETRDLETYARDKLARKGLDLIVANDVSQQGLGFGSDDNAALLMWPGDDAPGRESLPAQAKTALAEAILHRVIDRYRQTRSTFTGK